MDLTYHSREFGSARLLTAFLASLVLAACGGGSGAGTESADTGGTSAEACDPGDPGTADECGTVFVSITDADGDFLSYYVDVLSLTLQRANGDVVETLPSTTRIDFAQYVNLTEFLTAATVPPGTYVGGSIRLDYANAEVSVEVDGASAPAEVVGTDGQPLGITELDIQLDNRNRLVVARGLPSLLTVDFDLSASHTVDISQTPAVATAEPFIVAEIDPVDSKDIRVRGLLVDVNLDAMSYAVDLLPFHLRDGRFGNVRVHTSDDTAFEVDGEPYVGMEGLEAMAELETGAPTVALGTLIVADREFHAHTVFAGSSVPWADVDVVRGNVVARTGEELIVRGATLIQRSGSIIFNDDVVVTMGPNTRIIKTGHPDAQLDTSAVSIGQRIYAFGELTSENVGELSLDATNGRIRMVMTHLSGLVNSIEPDRQLNMTLQSIDRRRVSIFDFTGTGASPELDADPDDYEVATGNLALPNIDLAMPVRVFGFANAFGFAPPDFEGRTVIDLSDRRAVLGIGWTEEGTLEPFSRLDEEGIVLNLDSPDIGLRHHLNLGGVVIDLFDLSSSPQIVPSERRSLFAILQGRTVQAFTDYDDFLAELTRRLDGSVATRSFHARGGFDAGANIVTARKIAVTLIEN